MSMVDSFEKIHVEIFPNTKSGSAYVAAEIAHLIRQKQRSGDKCVLGLATGSTPIIMYAELVRLHGEEGLRFKNVTTFNLDEYFPIERTARQ
ncbi:MAG TPA: hypothetical protein VHB48_16890, partial [Chitinophagaceae bacterium]|nr:hypothetical protein [Chitinophagaceae bacterium]